MLVSPPYVLAASPPSIFIAASAVEFIVTVEPEVDVFTPVPHLKYEKC